MSGLNSRRRGAGTAMFAATLCICGSASAQSIVLDFEGPFRSNLGGSFALAGDLNSDQVPDYLVGDPIIQSGGEVVVLVSGSDGSFLHVFSTPTLFIQYGAGLAGGQDLDGDGVSDILIGANWGSTDLPASDTGSVFVYSGATFGLIREHVGSPGQNLGKPVAFLGDLDGDDVPEYAAGATHERGLSGAPQIGEAYVYSGASGAVLHSLSAGVPGDEFGWSIAGLGDVDRDGVSDFCVGARSASTQGYFLNGAVYLYSGNNGTLIRKDEGVGDLMSFGMALTGIPDVDGDGTDDYVTTAWANVNGAMVVSGSTGSAITYIQSSLAAGLSFPPSAFIDTIADVDGDGLREVLVRYYSDDNGNKHVLVASSSSGMPLYLLLDDFGVPSGFPGVVANAGDRDGDGRDEIAVTDLGASQTGGGYIFTLAPLVSKQGEISASSGGAVPFNLNAGVPRANAPYLLLASVTPAGPTSCGTDGIPVGPIPVHIPLCFDIVMQYSILLANTPPFVNTRGILDAVTGKGAAAFDLTGISLPPSAVGFSFHFAYIAKATGGGPWDLASNVESVEIVP